jgi:hypothetical protein
MIKIVMKEFTLLSCPQQTSFSHEGKAKFVLQRLRFRIHGYVAAPCFDIDEKRD